ncbi:MAG TPA: guanitoxin biosynthesis pre-guanitoxin forming N-methyltransferase GntF [Abditibacteriaceae bacterium]|nr:guanitoxin biosynthesis pre-guanitoxin forming N-methyltransferase GntF [Abditibacteriaceae bacterium]
MSAQPSEVQYADWGDWDPAAYNKEYYSEVTLDGRYLMEWVIESVQAAPPVDVALEFGSGPTVLHLFPLVAKAREIHVAEYLADNRKEVERWIAHEPGTHDWRPFTLEFLRMEGNVNPTDEQAQSREDEVRRRITRVLHGDAGITDPLGPDMRGYYPLVTSLCCADSATNDKGTWRLFMRNIASLVKPGGMLVLSACGEHSFYCVGERCFPGANISGQDMLASLTELGFRDIDIRMREVPDSSEHGFGCTILARAIKLQTAAPSP